MTVEIINAPIVLDTQAKSDLRKPKSDVLIPPAQAVGPVRQVSESINLAASQVEAEIRLSTKQQWIQASGPEESLISGLLLSSTEDIYAASPVGIYRLAPNASLWTLVSPFPSKTSADNPGIPMAEHHDTLYLVSPDEVLVSTHKGETWESLGPTPKRKCYRTRDKRTEDYTSPLKIRFSDPNTQVKNGFL